MAIRQGSERTTPLAMLVWPQRISTRPKRASGEATT
jgi:hypothetical protein